MIEKPIEIRALPSGAANDVVLLRGKTTSYVFKWLRHHEQFGLSRAEEFALQQQLAEAGLAAEVIALDPNQWVLQEYLHGTPLSDAQIQPTEKLRITAQTLARIHTQKPAWRGTSLWEKAEFYASRLGSETQHQLQLFKRTLASDERPVLCHFDLAFAHVLCGDRIKVIDWEYAGWGDRLTDIASTIEINQLDPKSRCDLCHYYSAETGITIDTRRLTEHQRFVRWLYQQWSKLLQQGARRE